MDRWAELHCMLDHLHAGDMVVKVSSSRTWVQRSLKLLTLGHDDTCARKTLSQPAASRSRTWGFETRHLLGYLRKPGEDFDRPILAEWIATSGRSLNMVRVSSDQSV